MLNESILGSVKKLLGVYADYTEFDEDILVHINSVFFVLQQLGIGPENGYRITDGRAVWDDYLPESPNLEAVKSYIYLKVRLMFDPPLNSSVLESINRQIAELEWRLNVQKENCDVGV